MTPLSAIKTARIVAGCGRCYFMQLCEG